MNKTDIVNMAMVKIGQKTLSSIDQDSPTATKVKTIYNAILDEALAAGPEKGWKFARNRITISVDANEPAFGYSYRYSLPDEFLRIASVTVGGTDVTDALREGQYILTNLVDDAIDLIYVKRVTITGLFPPHFSKVLYTMLAYHIAFNIVQNKNHANVILEELEKLVLPEAIGLDEQDRYVQEDSSAWIDAGRTTTTLE